MIVESPVERLAKTNPDMEIWWDSSPLVYEKWIDQMLAKAPRDGKDLLEAQLRRLYDKANPAESVFRGCTTNPKLSLAAVESDPAFWDRWLGDLRRSHPQLGLKELTWRTYKEVVRRGAEMYLPIFHASRHRFGWISGQLDPRLFTEKETMLQQAEELRSLQDNVMIKVPASKEGIEVLKTLTSKGISTNVTVCFTVAQILAAAKAVKEGTLIAEQSGVDLSGWRSVITMMMARLTERKALVEQASRRGIELSSQDKTWLGIAVFKRAYRMLAEGGYPSKMLACSVRPGPLVAGRQRYWDLEKLAGGEIVFTLPAVALEPLFAIGDRLQFGPEIEEEIPEAVAERFSRIPYCIQAYNPDGLDVDQFNSHPAVLYTIDDFSGATNGLEAYVARRMPPA